MVNVVAEHKSNRGDVATYEDIRFLEVILNDGERHIWNNGTHYIVTGIAETVSEGDPFYFEYGTPSVKEIVRIKESSEDGEKIAVFQDGMEQKINVLTGDYDMPMGDTGPPPKVEEQLFG